MKINSRSFEIEVRYNKVVYETKIKNTHHDANKSCQSLLLISLLVLFELDNNATKYLSKNELSLCIDPITVTFIPNYNIFLLYFILFLKSIIKILLLLHTLHHSHDIVVIIFATIHHHVWIHHDVLVHHCVCQDVIWIHGL